MRQNGKKSIEDCEIEKNMRTFGTISYNIYCNFTNYGSALQTWALHQTIKKMGHVPVLVDYCPDMLADKNPLNPFDKMWDRDEQSRQMVELTMPAIRENFEKFEEFYRKCFLRSKMKYTSSNLNEAYQNELLDGFVCGSDTIFCIDEFGFDDGYFANYDCMKGRSVAYAASFGDACFTAEDYKKLEVRIHNFKALGIREKRMIPWIENHTSLPVQRVLDPTLLLRAEEYAPIIPKLHKKPPYLLLYSRRYSPRMEEYAERIANENGWQIIEISLRAINEKRGHIMAYSAGCEEFLALVQHAEFVVTNSYHGMIFSVQFKKPFVIFSREQCRCKIEELLHLFDVSDRLMITGQEEIREIDYNKITENLEAARKESIEFLRMELEL